MRQQFAVGRDDADVGAEAWGVATFYMMLSTRPRPKRVLHVCDDVACRAKGAKATCDGLRAHHSPPLPHGVVGGHGDEPAGHHVTLNEAHGAWTTSPCLGLCDLAPAALYIEAGAQPVERSLGDVTAEFAMGLLGGGADPDDVLATVARGDAPPADKALACKRLAVYGSSASVADLAKLLSDERLASWARIPLEAIPGPASDEALRKAMDGLSGNLLVGVINSIGVRRDAGAVAALTAKLQDKDPEVASAAAVALATLAFPVRALRWRLILRDVDGHRLPLGPLWRAVAARADPQHGRFAKDCPCYRGVCTVKSGNRNWRTRVRLFCMCKPHQSELADHV